MTRPKAYAPKQGYQYQLLVLCPGDREYEHCDYAKDRKDLAYLRQNYREAYGPGFAFKDIELPQKYHKDR